MLYLKTDKWIDLIDNFVKPAIWVSLALLLLEVEPTFGLGGEHSRDGQWSWIFLWSERLIACFFTVEFVLRLWRSGPKKYVWTDNVFPYIHLSPFSWIDILSIAPFWIGFFVPTSWLHYIRITRILRLLKYYRYSRSLQLNALAFYRSLPQLKGLGLQLFLVSAIFTFVIYEAEHIEQPEAYGNLFKTAWFTIVTITTVGFGDRSPVTLIGMSFCGISLLFIIAQAASAIGVLNSAFDQVMQEEKDLSLIHI